MLVSRDFVNSTICLHGEHVAFLTVAVMILMHSENSLDYKRITLFYLLLLSLVFLEKQPFLDSSGLNGFTRVTGTQNGATLWSSCTWKDTRQVCTAYKFVRACPLVICLCFTVHLFLCYWQALKWKSLIHLQKDSYIYHLDSGLWLCENHLFLCITTSMY